MQGQYPNQQYPEQQGCTGQTQQPGYQTQYNFNQPNYQNQQSFRQPTYLNQQQYPTGNQKYCKACNNLIDATSKICPYCGAKNTKSIFKRIWFWLLIVVGIVSVIMAFNKLNKHDNINNPSIEYNTEDNSSSNIINNSDISNEDTDIVIKNRNKNGDKYIASISYNELAYKLDEYEDTYVKYYGSIVTIEDNNDKTLIRFAIDNSYNQPIMVEVDTPYSECKLNQDDYIAVYGKVSGGYTTQSTSQPDVDITLPYIIADKVEEAKIPNPDIPKHPSAPMTVKSYFKKSNKLYCTTELELFEITNISITSDAISNYLNITCNLAGVVSGSNYVGLSLDCYDSDGYFLGSGKIAEFIEQDKQFKMEEYEIKIPFNTVEIEVNSSYY